MKATFAALLLVAACGGSAVEHELGATPIIVDNGGNKLTSLYYTSWVYVTGPADWGTLQESTAYTNDYAVRASLSPLVGVSVQGDPEFTIDPTGCPGAQSCTATVSFLADVGGDYVAKVVGASSWSGTRVHGSSRSLPIGAHVVGANYTLTGEDSGGGTATFTLTSTGEADLLNATFAASTYADLGPPISVTSNTCGEDIPPGTACQVVVSINPGPEGWFGYVYVILRAYGNTRQQDPVRVTVAPPPVPE